MYVNGEIMNSILNFIISLDILSYPCNFFVLMDLIIFLISAVETYCHLIFGNGYAVYMCILVFDLCIFIFIFALCMQVCIYALCTCALLALVHVGCEETANHPEHQVFIGMTAPY
jgi:hypothetical protein